MCVSVEMFLAQIDAAVLLELRERLVARGAADAVVELVADLREPELWRAWVGSGGCTYR